MAHGSKLIEALIWMGLNGPGIELHRSRYEENPEEHLVSFASSLFSGRLSKEHQEELKELIPRLHAFSARPVQCLHPVLAKALDRADVVSTIFEWASRQGDLPQPTREHLLTRAEMIVGDACGHASELFGPYAHERSLLLLTQTRIRFRKAEQVARTGLESAKEFAESIRAAGQQDLADVEAMAPCITDRRQRERVYRKLGLLHRLYGSSDKARHYGWKALCVPHLAVGVKLKSIAALMGLDL